MGGWIVRECGMYMYTLLYFKWINSEDQLYSTRNSAQCYVVAWLVEGGGVCGRMDTCICIPESLLCSSETVTTLLINWKIQKKNFKNIEEEKKEVYVLLLASVHRHALHSRVIQICLEWDWRSSSFLTSSLFHNNPCWLQHSSLVRILGRNQELPLAQLWHWLTFPGWSMDPPDEAGPMRKFEK